MMNILFATSESLPYLKTGGLADVVPALAQHLFKLKNKVYLALPGYDVVWQKIVDKKFLHTITQPITKEKVEIYVSNDLKPIKLFIFKNAHFEKKENPYINAKNQDWEDNATTFSLFSWAVASLAYQQKSKVDLDIVVSNDWQTGLIPAYIRKFNAELNAQIKTAHIIHNISFPGIFSWDFFRQLDLPTSYLQTEGLEYHGKISFQKAGLFFADKIFTVSQQYAREIQTSHEFGMGFEGLLAHRTKDVVGILNGIDTTIWSSKTNPHIVAHYGISNIHEKENNKKDLLHLLSSTKKLNPEKPLVGIVSRLSHQKGIDVVIDYFKSMEGHQHFNFVILASGDEWMTGELKTLAKYLDNLIFINKYDEALSQKIISGSDIFLMPSRFEPCGLTQMYAMQFGTLPLVNPVGGLKDSVIAFDGKNEKEATGFSLDELDIWHLNEQLLFIKETLSNKRKTTALQKNAMRIDFSWKSSAELYQKAFAKMI